MKTMFIRMKETEAIKRDARNILLVDDEEDVLEVAKQMLETFKYNVIVARNGLEAVKIFEQKPYEIDCVILDLTMPHMDGVKTFAKLQGLRKDVCVIISSGYSEDVIKESFSGKTIAGFIQKPYKLNDMNKTLNKVFNKDS